MVDRKLAGIQDSGRAFRVLTVCLFKLAIRRLLLIDRVSMAVFTAVMLNPISNLIFKDFNQSLTDRAISYHQVLVYLS